MSEEYEKMANNGISVHLPVDVDTKIRSLCAKHGIPLSALVGYVIEMNVGKLEGYAPYAKGQWEAREDRRMRHFRKRYNETMGKSTQRTAKLADEVAELKAMIQKLLPDA